MPPVPQVAQQISQEENQQQNGPNLPSLLNSLPAAHSRNPVLPQQVQPAGWDKNLVLVVPAAVPSQQQVYLHIIQCLYSTTFVYYLVWEVLTLVFRVETLWVAELITPSWGERSK